ncbi:MAG: LamG-like jellyroll fold domain-containing protein [bacterium]|nr:LamG-like jellyroll fold domain-containing protein [bacterium]
MQKKTYYLITTLLLLLSLNKNLYAQVPGDTIKVKTFHYGSNIRDTVARFPQGNLSYEKIIMKYNMRCKNGLVSNGTDRNLGCGEWDYSCNTYLVDSSKIEEALSLQPNYVIANFTGTNFLYTTKPVCDYYQYTQQKLTLSSILSDSLYSLKNGTANITHAIKTNENSGKSQFIYTAAELSAAGLTAGQIQSIILNAQNAATANFLKVKIKHTNAQNLTNGMVDPNNLTEVFNSDYSFNIGSNRIPFKTAFTWNGTQNILIEFSFTNSQPSTQLTLLGAADSAAMGITTQNNYAIDLANNGHIKLDTTLFSSIKSEFTIAFWAFGKATQIPQSNSIFYATDANINNRQLNIHLPHSSNNVYFDCGFAAGGYDRINKVATPQEQDGRWNHWAFTKNATTGNMNIYLNGVLWLNGTGKTKPITLLNMVLGKDINLASNFKGKLNELAIWNKEVNDSLVRSMMQNAQAFLSNNSANLVAFYPLHDGSGQTVTETNNNKNVAGVNLSWTYDRGDQLNRNFTTTTARPAIQFSRGDYTISTQNTTARDSVKRNTNEVNSYAIISKGGITPITNDVVNLVSSTNNLYQASSSKIYNGDVESLPIIDSINNASEGSYAISNLSYFRRFPWYNEIMSFVTPYGIGLNLGINGKDWYFDVTDFAPILKGNKRLLMSQGGQNQEQNDIEFWFIVGTPPRNVLEFNQIWQGATRAGGAALTAINNETRFAPTTVPILNTGKAFKMRSSITGHGAEGEFEVNGGQINHQLNINGGATEFTWTISQECAFNPVFPQGGTWVYDRQGWCPGEASLLKENNLTPHVTAGSNATIDYNASTPPTPGGSYNYLVAHQLVTYGDYNFNRDLRIVDVLQPSNKVLHSRKNPMCDNPKVVIQNTGSSTITQAGLDYWVNDGSKLSQTWNGNLSPMSFDTVILSHAGSLWTNGNIKPGINVFNTEIKSVNGNANDDYVLNNKFRSNFTLTELLPASITLEFRTNNRPTENSFKLYDDWGTLIDSKDFTEANTTFTKNYVLGGCYKLVVEDKGHDGVQWWANTAQGTGFIRIKRDNGQIIKTFQPDFGGGFTYGFTANWLMAEEELNSFGKHIQVYPNPTNGSFVVEGKELENANISITDILGHIVEIPFRLQAQSIKFDAIGLPAGMYLIIIEKGENRITKRVLVL